MTPLKLRLRSLWYFRAVNIAAAAGVAVATTVLSGALMVGDSVRGSLAELATQRLGKIDQALLGSAFFDQSLAKRVAAEPSLGGKFEIDPAIIERGSAASDAAQIKTSGVQILGEGANWVNVDKGKCVLSSSTADSLDIHSIQGDVVLSIPTEMDLPSDATLARRSHEDVISGLRAQVAAVISEPGMVTLFSAAGGQRAVSNAWVNLADLQEAVDQPGRVNTLFVHDNGQIDNVTEKLNAAMGRVLTLDDYGLSISPTADGKEAVLTSRGVYLNPQVEMAAEATGVPLKKIIVNFLNSATRLGANGQELGNIHYAVAAGISSADDLPLKFLEVAINQWAADQLGAKVGDQLGCKYYVRKSDGSLAETSEVGFRIARILPMNGIGADASLTPTYKGLTDADSIADWNPPAGVQIDQKLVTKSDEAYWKKYRAAPKIFFSYEDARRISGQDWENLTSIRVPADQAEKFAKQLLAHLDPAAMGMAFRPLREQQLAAANGSVDFGQLFEAFSFFLIAAAVLLAAMLFRMAVEQRARQLGLMASLGFSGRALRKIMLGEQMMVSLAGGIAGSVGAIAYTWLMMAGLRTWWVGAVGTTSLRLFVEPNTLFSGFLEGQFASLFATAWAMWQVAGLSPARLLAGAGQVDSTARRGARRSGWIAIFSLLLGMAAIFSGVTGGMRQQDAFLSGGTLLLISCLCGASVGLHWNSRRLRASSSLGRLAMRNATRHPARGVLCVGLIAAAAFTLVTVSAMKQGEPTDTGDLHSGSGGFRLMIQTQIPLLADPGTAAGREMLAFRNPADPIWDRVKFMPMRRRSGQDVSCLNLTQPTNPTILGVPDSLIDRSGFSFASTPSLNKGNPWESLRPQEFTSVPFLADDSTAQYILHISPGQTLDVAGHSYGLAATLAGSIFQSELLISDSNFRTLFPKQSGFSVVLVEVSAADEDRVRRLLSEELSDYGAQVQTTASVLAGYLQVQNTYLSTFAVLGALGLMLGTVGLAVVLVRTVIERRAELALLASLGFGSWKRVRLVLWENFLLLVSGLVAGSVCAFIGVLPAIKESARSINFSSMAFTLFGALACGLCASGLAVLIAGRNVAAADLRRE